MKRISFFAVILAMMAFIPLANLEAQPLNDECATAEAVGEGAFPWDNTGSVVEGPIDCDVNMATDVWFLYTPTTSGNVAIETCNGGGLNDDTVLIVYDGLAGCPTAGAACLASADDNCANVAGGAAFMSQVTLDVIAGESYYVQVGGWNGAVGDGILNINFTTAEICDDGIDNDVDGLTDCFDPDCVGAPNCFEGDTATCGDGIDNDGDGFVDCADGDCAGIGSCGVEICDDGIDNDGDGLIDCFDSQDCPLGSVFCPISDNDDCLGAEIIAINGPGTYTANMDSTLATPSGLPAPTVPCNVLGAIDNDIWYSITPDQDMTWEIHTCDINSWDTDLIVYEGSDCTLLTDIACDGDGAGLTGCQGFYSRIVGLQLFAGVEYKIRVGSWGAGASGQGILTLNAVIPAAEICDDGLDNDVDGLVDCLDPDCVADPICFEGDDITCGDGIDNDADGLIDCVDPDCSGTNACGTEICGDGLDNDADTLVDCFDPDCAADPLCLEGDDVTCADGADNDADGLIDCLDPDCVGTTPCPAAPNDDCANAEIVGEGNFPWDNSISTLDGPIDCDDNMDTDVWFLYTATVDGTALIQTCDGGGSNDDTVLIVYDALAGCPIAGAPCLASADDTCANVVGGAAFMSNVELPVIAGESYYIQVGGWNGAQGNGFLDISTSCGATTITNLVATYDCATDSATVTWDDGGFDTYDISRDGVVLASGLAAGTTSYVDSTALSNGTYEYTVNGNCTAAGSSVTGSVFMNVSCASGGETDIIFKTETDLGQINSSAALEAALTANGLTFLTVVDFPSSQLGNVIGVYDRVWVCSGTFPEDGRMTDADVNALGTWVEAGVGVYFEGGDHWGFAQVPGSFDNYDGVTAALDGDDTFLAITGLDTGLGVDFSSIVGVPYNQDAAGNDWTDQLTVGPEAGGPNVAPIWQEANGVYITGAYSQNQDPNGDPIGNVLVQSWEFGGYGGDQTELAGLIVGALGGGGGGPTLPEFVRGDCNADGGFNIADAIFLLAALFSGGPAGTCLDSCDANDDGGINIADAIFSLAALFSGGPAPTPTTCGVDPTDTDALDCVSFPPCP